MYGLVWLIVAASLFSGGLVASYLILWCPMLFLSTRFSSEQAGIQVLLDFVDDDVPFYLKHEEGGRTLCLPYCMDAWLMLFGSFFC